MGYRKIPTIHTLIFDGDLEGLVVRVKGVSFGRIRKLLNLVNDESDDNTLEELASQLADCLVSWNLEDEEGVPVEATREGIDDQDWDFVMAVITKWLSEMTGANEELGKDSPSGVSFPGQPLTMEAL